MGPSLVLHHGHGAEGTIREATISIRLTNIRKMYFGNIVNMPYLLKCTILCIRTVDCVYFVIEAFLGVPEIKGAIPPKPNLV